MALPDQLFYNTGISTYLWVLSNRKTALANPIEKFLLGIRKVVEDLMMERMGENDRLVTRYMDDAAFRGSALPLLARETFAAIQASRAGTSPPAAH